MRPRSSKFLAGAVISVIAAIWSVVGATGASAATPQYVELPVSQTFDTNSASASGEFTYQLTGEDAEPMPDGSSSGGYAFTMDGTSDVTLPKIVFNTVGIYQYSLSCVKSDNAFYVYDSQVYTIEVYVTNDTSSPTVLVYLDDGSSAGDKAPVITFTQTYQGPVEPPPSPTTTPTPQPVGASAQTGGVLASNANELLLAAFGLLSVAAVGVIVILARKRKAEEKQGDEL